MQGFPACYQDEKEGSYELLFAALNGPCSLKPFGWVSRKDWALISTRQYWVTRDLVKQIDSLTGVRGIAAMWVVLLHGISYVNTSAVLPAYVENLIIKGWLGVDLFFILSGFVISYVHQSDFLQLNGSDISRFLKLRIARIYPAHFTATMVLIPVVFGATLFSIYSIPQGAESQYSLSKLFYSLLLINGWGFPDSIGWNVPSWSVGSEWFAYLCFPIIAFAYNKIKNPWHHLLLIILIFSTMVLLAALLNDMQKYMLDEYLSLTRIASEFVIGCSLYNIHARLQNHYFFDLTAIFAAVLVIVIAALGLSSFYDFLIIIAFALLLLSLSRSVDFAAKLFSNRTLLYLGRISYSIYLAHATILMVFNQIFKRLVSPDVGDTVYLVAFYSIYIACSILAGHLLFTLIEKPARNYLRRKWDV
jgi:peptidoglycan/LPS O-acetylase OafA/YrhL